MDEIPVAPGGLRAGQLGVIMIGRVIIGDIAVTLVDLVQRELLRVEETGGGDWLLTPAAAPTPESEPEPLLAYEERLLKALADAGPMPRLSSLAAGFGRHLDEARAELVREAARRGWIRHLHHGQRTPEGEDLARQVRSFQRELRRLKSERGLDAVAGRLLPYGLHFGFVTDDSLPLARFARAWVRTFMAEPGWSRPQPARARFDELHPGSDRDEAMARHLATAAFFLGAM